MPPAAPALGQDGSTSVRRTRKRQSLSSQTISQSHQLQKNTTSNAMSKQEDMAMLFMHRFDGVPWKPSSVVGMCSSKDGTLCVCVREDGCVEMYDVEKGALVRSVHGRVDACPSSVVVVEEERGDSVSNHQQNRVFVGCMDGTIVEMGRSEERLVCDSHGGSVWDLDAIAHDSASTTQYANEYISLIAAACDDGCVRIFGVEKDNVPGVTLVKSMLPVSGRVLCVAWHTESSVVVAGGTDGCLHVWNVESGREVTRITVDGLQGDSPPCIWSVMVLQDGTIVSGDSLGQVTFWDGRFGTMVAKFNPHGVDVLALEKSADGEFVFATGVDPRISVFKRVMGGDRVEWAYVSSKQEHALDVRALCCCYDEKKKESGNSYRLFSGGNDAVVVSHSVERFLKEAPQRMSLAPQRPHASVSRVAGGDGQIMATSVGNMVNIWTCLSGNTSHLRKMGQYKDGDVLPADSLGGMHPVHLAQVSCSSRAHVTSVAVSGDGKYIACSDIHSLKCIELLDSGYTNDADGSVVPIVHPDDYTSHTRGMKMVPLPHHASTQGIVHMEFIPHSDSLVLCIHDGTIRVIESVKNDDVSDVVIRDVHDLRYKTWFKKDEGKSSARRECPMIDVVSMSTTGQYIALTVRNRVFILSLQNRRIMTQIPSINTVKSGGLVAAMEFLEDDLLIAIATSSGEIGLFDVSSGDMCALVGQDVARMHDLDLDSPVIGMTATSASSRSVMVYTANALCHVNLGARLLDESIEAQKLGRRPRDKKLKLGYGKAATGRNCRVLPSQHPLLFVQYSDPNNLIVIQKPWEHVWKSKMAPLARHTYGQ